MKHKKNEFEFAQFPHGDQVKYHLKINGETEFESINEDWLQNTTSTYSKLVSCTYILYNEYYIQCKIYIDIIITLTLHYKVTFKADTSSVP